MGSPITRDMHRRVEQQKREYKAHRVELEHAFPQLHFAVIGVDVETRRDVWLCSRRRDMKPAGFILWNCLFNSYSFLPANLETVWSVEALDDIKRFIRYAEEVSK